MKPLLLLDIDGVLCPFGRSTLDGLEPVPGHEFAVYDPAHSIYLKELSGLYDLAWASLWENSANIYFSPAHGLPQLPYVKFLGNFDLFKFANGQTFKLSPVKRFIGDRPMAWVDDDLYYDAFDWARERDETVPTLLINTDPAEGLSLEIIQRLREWPSLLNLT